MGSLTMNIITLASLFLSSLVLIQGKGFRAALNGGKNLNGPEPSVNESIWQRICSILQEAYPNWMPLTELLHTYEQLYQEAFPPGIQMRNICGICGYLEAPWNEDVCPDRST